MSPGPLRIAVIIGSVREGRFGPTVARWFAGEAERHGGVRVDLVDLADHSLPLTMPAHSGALSPATREAHDRLRETLASADAFAVVTPEYNHTAPPALTNTVNWFLDEWKAKPVGLISYGGMGGGLRAAEHLRQVFAEVHATTVRDQISFHNAGAAFGPDGLPLDAAGSERAAKTLLGQLLWWGEALRGARASAPYIG
ncbi:NADPH-dependent FMN reductase [Streptomyces cyaneofuscatus]|uniref:NADPH-dependent FMN reductase n=1 Tax=Streptomyces cyaneofuscatus TaxID=66883 RepID=UPI0034384B6F